MRGLDGARGRFMLTLLVLAGVLARLVIVARLELEPAALGASVVACGAALLGVFWLVRGGFGAAFLAVFSATLLPLPLHAGVLLLPAGQVSVGTWCIASMLLLGAWFAAASPAAASPSFVAGVPAASGGFGPCFVGPFSFRQGLSTLLGLLATRSSALLTLLAVCVAAALSGMLWLSPRGASASTPEARFSTEDSEHSLATDDSDEADWVRALKRRLASGWFSPGEREEANGASEGENGPELVARPAPAPRPARDPTPRPARARAPQPQPAPAAPAAATATSKLTSLSGREAAVAGLLGSYYADLNASTFDANRYFEPQVEQYITMKNTSTSAMNRYIHNVFPTQFKQHHFSLEEGSLSQEGPNQYVFVEASSYYLVAKRKQLDQRVMVRIRLSPHGKLVFFHQFKRLPKQPQQAP